MKRMAEGLPGVFEVGHFNRKEANTPATRSPEETVTRLPSTVRQISVSRQGTFAHREVGLASSLSFPSASDRLEAYPTKTGHLFLERCKMRLPLLFAGVISCPLRFL